MSFDAADGIITAPFVVHANRDVFQPTETSLANVGQALYFFTITDPGDYVVSPVVNAPNTASDSFFVNIDAQPTDPVMIWDIIPLTSGFESRVVGWRGTGTPDNPQYPEKAFSLSAGTHQLIIRGREANVKLRAITIGQAP